MLLLRNFAHDHIDPDDVKFLTTFGVFYNRVAKVKREVSTTQAQLTSFLWDEGKHQK